MKVRDLKASLAHANDDDEVIIHARPVKDGKVMATVGTLPHAGIRQATPGFDWESGLFVIEPDRELRYDQAKK